MSEQAIDLQIDYKVYDEEYSRVLEINVAVGNTEVNIITDLPVDTLQLQAILGTLPQAVGQVLGRLDPKEIA